MSQMTSPMDIGAFSIHLSAIRSIAKAFELLFAIVCLGVTSAENSILPKALKLDPYCFYLKLNIFANYIPFNPKTFLQQKIRSKRNFDFSSLKINIMIRIKNLVPICGQTVTPI
ncbi:hypothetical protein BpHYR1_000207 [Brachionus plicatilis]|uniref:Uncharacterized protein n=1 Tax=Brachionus plicatilis TaxID=10195 RepID=A0A3M7SDV7_BRAPC|nr:hypothetical protein BpHYR1_000207 [Brachionus plicatilis]